MLHKSRQPPVCDESRHRPLLVAMSVGLLLGFSLPVAGWWWWQNSPNAKLLVDLPKEELTETRPRVVVEAVAHLHPKPVPSSIAKLAEDSVTLMAKNSDESAESLNQERKHSHPITPEHRRLYRENAFHGNLMGAMNVSDYEGIRALVKEYQQDYPEDAYRLQEGFTLIANCLEKLTPQRQSAARTYWETKRGSVVRRFVRRHCLDKPTVED